MLQAQTITSVDIWSRLQLEELPENHVVDAFVSIEEFDAVQRQAEVFAKYIYEGKVAFRVPAGDLKNMIRSGELATLQCDFNQGEVLIKNSKKLSNYDSMQMIRMPFGRKYTGKGVLMGIIDAGIDFNHPDFRDKNGNTRVKAIWDQRQSGNPARVPSFGYGQVWDSTDIALGLCTHVDQNQWFGHGSNVSSIAAGNGLSDSIGDYAGFAPEASIAVVSIDFSSPNFTEKVADGVEFLYRLADSLGMPCVINASLGTYVGSHDGLDFQARRIQTLINAKASRSMVCAAGNSGEWPAYHLAYSLQNDTAFTWFEKRSGQSVFFELWGDTANMSNLQFNLSFNHPVNYSRRAESPRRNMMSLLGQTINDTLYSGTNRLGIVQTWRAIEHGRIRMQVYVPVIDSSAYLFRFQLEGSGRADVWSSSRFGWSDIVASPLPSAAAFPEIINYQSPDKNQSIVSSWACLDEVVTVGNIVNNSGYVDYGGTYHTYALPEASIANSSSRGPTRLGRLKPDLVAPGERSFAAGRLVDLNIQRNVSSLHFALAPSGYHNRNGGTSMASPAVAGAIALLLERCSALSQEQLINMLHGGAKKRVGDSLNFGYGQLDVAALLNQSIDSRKILSSNPSNELCLGDTLQLSLPSSVRNILWNNGANSRSIAASSPGAYHAAFLNNSLCPASSDTVLLQVFEPKKFSFNRDTTLCAGQRIGITGQFDRLLWSTGEVQPSIEPLQTGLYGLVSTDSNGCKWSDSIFVKNIFPLPEPKLGADTVVCFGDMLVLYPGAFAKYAWSNGSNLAVLHHRGTEDYTLTVTDSNGCTAQTSIRIEQIMCLRLSQQERENEGIRVYPNPSKGLSNLESVKPIQRLWLSDIQGRTIGQLSSSSQTNFLLKSESSGLYFVNLLFEDGERKTLKWQVDL